MNAIDKVLDVVLGLFAWGNLVLLVGYAVSIGLIWAGINGYIAVENAKSWPTTKGTVVISYATQEVSESGGERYHHYVPQLSYDYTIADYIHHGNEDGLEVNKFSTMEEAEAVAKKYPVDKKVKVFYNPDDPYESFLEHGAYSKYSASLVGTGVFFLVFVSIFTYMIFLEAIKR